MRVRAFLFPLIVLYQSLSYIQHSKEMLKSQEKLSTILLHNSTFARAIAQLYDYKQLTTK